MASQRRGPWSQREDQHLMHLVQSQGPLNWVGIAHQIHSRTPKQCRERYHQNLKPSLNHEPITPDEGAYIEELVGHLGKRWAEIARRLKNRSDNAVKNWWNGSMNRRKRSSTRRRTTGSYDAEQHAASLAYPPCLPAIPSRATPHHLHSYTSQFHRLGQHSPPMQQFSYPPWNVRSGLPSPASQGRGSIDLTSSPTSPATGHGRSGSPVALPPLRYEEEEVSPAARQFFEPSPNFRPQLALDKTIRLPPLFKDVTEDRPQLPTAPSSPGDICSIPPRPSPQCSGTQRAKEGDSRMRLGHLLS